MDEGLGPPLAEGSGLGVFCSSSEELSFAGSLPVAAEEGRARWRRLDAAVVVEGNLVDPAWLCLERGFRSLPELLIFPPAAAGESLVRGAVLASPVLIFRGRQQCHDRPRPCW